MGDSGGRRRSDRVLDPELPSGIEHAETARVRDLRNDCREEEARLSYVRRLLQARIDIVRAEVDRRAGRGEATSGLIDELPRILADQPSPRREARAMSVRDVDAGGGQRAEDQLLQDSTMSRLPELSEEDLRELAERLTETEQEVSRQRRVVLDHLDALQEALVARYRDGRATVDDVLSQQR